MAADPREILDDQGQAFWRAAEAAHDVRDRYQFFVWLRLHLNRFLPHDLALCLFRDGQEVRVEVFDSVPVARPALDDLGRGRSRWWRELEEAWLRAGSRAAVVPLAPATSSPESAALHAAGFRSLAVDGFDAGSGLRPESLFAFAMSAGESLSPRRECIAAHLALCLPVLHCTAVRALASRAATARAPASSCDLPRNERARGDDVALTRRQTEIIAAVRDAKRNAEIGLMLGISAATVKNHLHTIMRKLQASNRAQAVAEAMARRLIS